VYIPRTLIAAKGSKDERRISESDIAGLGRVVVLLGEPGIGKSELTKQLESSTGAVRIAAGTFNRTADLSVYRTSADRPIIIDGLDEIPASGTEPAIDKVLGRLSELGNPKVIISCRAADWTGASNRAKFQSDYGVLPVSVQIIPFDNEQARAFLAGYDPQIDADKLLSVIDSQGLNDLVGNPLTLRLLAEVWLQDGGLPATKTELLDRATLLLISEENDAHDQSHHVQTSSEALLSAAGAMFAHLLLSGAVGIATNNRRKATEGFIPLTEFDNICIKADATAVTKTRLFKAEAEDHIVPVHRVVAEYLAGRWLSRKLDDRLSERRLFALLQFNGGVPSALRGLHAWLGYFSPSVRERCIDADPYGFLRYGETTSLSAQSARHLLNTLAKLAEDDPYFRSEDWSVRSVRGLAQPELKSEIVALITSRNRHVQLSALVLESLTGSPLTAEILPELVKLMKDARAPFVERSRASEALAKSGLAIDWRQLVRELLAQKKHDSWRLAAETIGDVGPEKFPAEMIADVLIALNGINESERRETRVVGADYTLIRCTSAELAQSVLDRIAVAIEAKRHLRHWRPGRSITSAIERLIETAINGPPIEPRRFWSWVRHLGNRFTHQEQADRIRDYLLANPEFRRQVQRLVLYDETVDGGPWMAIVHELPNSLAGLSLSIEDAICFLREIADTKELTTYQSTVWNDLVQATWRRNQRQENLQRVIDQSIRQHERLGSVFEAIKRPPERDYEAEHRKRQQQYESKQQAKYRQHRAGFEKELPKIASGQQIGALISLAQGYLGRFSDLRDHNNPRDRLVEWVGEEVADAACQGFVATLTRDDLPDLSKICSIRIEGKHWTIEPIMLAGIAELVRADRSLVEIPVGVVRAVLGIWWDMPEFNSTQLGDDIEKALEQAVFVDEQSIETFVTTVIEPQMSKEHVTGLYRFAREPRFLSFSPRLALRWLRNFPNAAFNSQLELIQLLIWHGDRTELIKLIEDRVGDLDSLDEQSKQLWIAAAFCFVPSALPLSVSREIIWQIKSIILPDRTERAGLNLPVDRYAAIVRTFAPEWPMVGHPVGGWSGDQNPWDASEFITYCINAIGANRTAEGTEAICQLSSSLRGTGYADHLKHVGQEQRRNRRDAEYSIQTFDSVRKVLENLTPATVTDLKMVMLDHLADVQKYIRDADTSGWEAFWSGDRPKDENVCRDRLLDLIRPRLGGGIELFPELPMPDRNRVDIYATILGQGLPIEIKGQWHPEVWNASKTQLDDKYCRDWRTGGYGVYLVLWFGEGTGRDLTLGPSCFSGSLTHQELAEQLSHGLAERDRLRIEIVVLDVSRPTTKKVPPDDKAARRARKVGP
jgi:hypothetical protein